MGIVNKARGVFRDGIPSGVGGFVDFAGYRVRSTFNQTPQASADSQS